MKKEEVIRTKKSVSRLNELFLSKNFFSIYTYIHMPHQTIVMNN